MGPARWLGRAENDKTLSAFDRIPSISASTKRRSDGPRTKPLTRPPGMGHCQAAYLRVGDGAKEAGQVSREK